MWGTQKPTKLFSKEVEQIVVGLGVRKIEREMVKWDVSETQNIFTRKTQRLKLFTVSVTHTYNKYGTDVQHSGTLLGKLIFSRYFTRSLHNFTFHKVFFFLKNYSVLTFNCIIKLGQLTNCVTCTLMGNRLDKLIDQFRFRNMILKVLESIPASYFPIITHQPCWLSP